MTCREQIMSEEYRDFVVSQLNPNELQTVITEETCTVKMRFLYDSIYLSQESVEPISYGRFSYNSLPKCFALLDTQAMTDAGIYQIQNY